jgi:hypothetical protein
MDLDPQEVEDRVYKAVRTLGATDAAIRKIFPYRVQ